MRLAGVVSAGVLALFAAEPAAAFSKAAEYLIAEQVSQGCDDGSGRGGAGRFSAGSVEERDLTGDGKPDLVIDHSGLNCANGGRSGMCGVRACSVFFYVREGALLTEKLEILSIGVSIGPGSPPKIGLIGHMFQKSTIRWRGSAFK